MSQLREKFKESEQECQRQVRILLEGKNSEFWNILQSEILRLRDNQNNFLDSFKSKKLLSQNVEDYNLAIARRECYSSILNLIDFMVAERNSFYKKTMNVITGTGAYFKDSFLRAFK